MKKLILLLFIPLVSFGQVENLIEPIFGESSYVNLGQDVHISSNGNVFAFSSPHDTNDEANPDQSDGIIRVYSNQNGWNQIGEDINNTFGWAAQATVEDLSGDGNTVVVSGKIFENGSYISAMETYKYINNEWQQIGQTYLINDESIGPKASINYDGSIIVLGYKYFGQNQGKVQVLQLEENIWVELGDVIYGPDHNYQFGADVKINDIGNRIAVISGGGEQFSFYCDDCLLTYDFDEEDNTWIESGANIFINELQGQVQNAPISFDFNSAGDVLAVGYNNGISIGGVVLYNYNQNEWMQSGNHITKYEENNQSQFGSRVSINGEGSIISVSSNSGPNEWNGCTNNGEINIYNFLNDEWINVNTIVGDWDEFDAGSACWNIGIGYSIEMSSNSSVLITGNPYSNEGGFSSGGSVKVFDISNPCVTLPLTAVCNEIEISLENGFVTISADDINDGSYGCNEFSLEIFNQGTNFGSEITFNTTHIGDNTIQLMVTDSSGNSSYCTAIVNVQAGMGIEDNTLANISLYPNPTTDLIFIEGANTELEAIVFDLLGKELIRENINGRLDISCLEKGTYIINLTDGVNTSTHKIIKE